MPDPVIMDDGGSTRVKLLLPVGVGAMDSLLDVGALAAVPGVPVPAGTRGSQHTINDAYNTIVIMFQDKTGTPRTIGPSAFANFEVSSGNQRIRGDVTGGGAALVLTIFSPAGQDPIVDAKQHKQKRRYVVLNAPPIDQIRVNGALVFDAAAPPIFVPPVAAPVIYTSVVLS